MAMNRLRERLFVQIGDNCVESRSGQCSSYSLAARIDKGGHPFARDKNSHLDKRGSTRRRRAESARSAEFVPINTGCAGRRLHLGHCVLDPVGPHLSRPSCGVFDLNSDILCPVMSVE